MTIENCDNCGACCREMNSPPGYAMLAGPSADHWLKQIPEDNEDRQIFEAMPEELKKGLRDHYAKYAITDHTEDGPCCWYDEETNSCRHYEHRPTICRDFEVGSEACQSWRELYQITD